MLRDNWYVLVATFFIIAPSAMVDVPDSGWVRLSLPAGLALGVLWQVLDRRDLADRLTVLAVIAVASAALMFLPSLRTSLFHLMAFQGVVAGLVLAERVLRRRDRRTSPVEGEPLLEDAR